MNAPVNIELSQPADEAAPRKAWEPLGYEKLPAADAEGGFTGTGSDNGFYS
jgi:hypothetical protein